jgi:hypothetical protein
MNYIGYQTHELLAWSVVPQPTAAVSAVEREREREGAVKPK